MRRIKYFQTAPRSELIAAFGVYGFFVVGAILAAVTPADILNAPWAQNFVNEVAVFVPFVERVGKVSPIPQVAQFFSAVMWIFAIALLFICSYAALCNENRVKDRVIRQFQNKRLRMTYFAIVCIYLIWFMYVYPVDGSSRLVRIMIGSRAGLGIFGSMSILSFAVFGLGLVILARYWTVLWRHSARRQ